MGLIKDISDVQKYVAVANDIALTGLLPEINEIEENVIIPHIGSAFYVEIEAAYQAAPTAPQQLVIDRLQECIGNLAVGQYLDTVQISISDTGLTRAEGGSEKTAYKYQKEEAKGQMLRKGWLALENLLAFLETAKATYPTWAASPEYTVNKELIINSAGMFDKHYSINKSRLLYHALRYILKQVEEMEVEDVIGTALLDEIKAEILVAGVSGDNQKLLDRFIYAAVANLAIVRGLSDMIVKLDVNGAVVYDKLAMKGEGTYEQDNIAPLDRISAKKFNVQNVAAKYLEKLKNYLNINASATKYAAFFNSELYEAPITDSDEEYDSNVFY
jgi:uncharacterized protein DUF6712